MRNLETRAHMPCRSAVESCCRLLVSSPSLLFVLLEPDGVLVLIVFAGPWHHCSCDISRVDQPQPHASDGCPQEKAFICLHHLAVVMRALSAMTCHAQSLSLGTMKDRCELASGHLQRLEAMSTDFNNDFVVQPSKDHLVEALTMLLPIATSAHIATVERRPCLK